jgi:hypothetical protein
MSRKGLYKHCRCRQGVKGDYAKVRGSIMETESKSKNMEELPIEIQEILKNMDFPASRNDIVKKEMKSGAISDILRALGMLPEKNYNSAEDVAKELHKIFVGIPS